MARDGGPVHPCTVWTQGGHRSGESMGMSLRDAAALAALQGIIYSTPQVRVTAQEAEEWPETAARAAWAIADAFIAARAALQEKNHG